MIHVLLLITWELAQTLLGLIIFMIYEMQDVYLYKGRLVCVLSDANFGISLGPFIIMSGNNPDVRDHEYGHCRQSRLLGPLYLIVVGIPSVVQNILSRMIGGSYSNNYYNRFPEKWADKLGKVNRRII